MDSTAETSSVNQIPKKEEYLIALNKFKKITFFGSCKVEIDTQNQRLTFQTNATEEKFQEFVSRFNTIIVQKENALCIIDVISNNDFIVIFPSKETCDTIIEEINKVVYPSGPPTADPVTDDNLFKNNFYIPVLKEIQSKITGAMEIKTVLLDLVNKFEADQRQTYMNMVFEMLVLDTDSAESAVNESNTTKAVNDEANVKSNETFHDSLNSVNNKYLNDTTRFSSSYSCKRSASINDFSKNFPSYISYHDSSFSSSAPEKSRKSSVNDNQQNESLPSTTIIKLPDFKILQHKWDDGICPKLVVFDLTDKTMCYEYNVHDRSKNEYRCYECRTKFQCNVYAKVSKIEEGEDFVVLGSDEHLCKPKKFITTASETRVIQKSNFKIEMIPHKIQSENSTKILNIYDPDYGNQKFSYYFGKKDKRFFCKGCSMNGKYVSAKLIEDENGEECIELSAVKHVCL